MTDHVHGPTYDEMLDPSLIRPDLRQAALAAKAEGRELDPVNLFNITWKDEHGRPRFVVLPKALTGVDAPIAVMYGREFPTGSHKVGATWSITMEAQLSRRILPDRHTCVWPSTGNYGIGGAWVSGRTGYRSLVLLPAEMSEERFRKIAYYGSDFVKTPGCESNVKEIYDECARIRATKPDHVVLNQFEELANYRFHYYVTGNSALEAAAVAGREGVGNGRPAAFVSAMGSSGTIAAGDRMKEVAPGCRIVGVEPVQCPTLFDNGFGGHDIQGIGDKHVTWIHNVMNMDMMVCIDDMEAKQGLQLLTDPVGTAYLRERAGLDEPTLHQLSTLFGISGVCNILASIKAAKAYGFGKDDLIVTVATDSIDRYHTVMAQLDQAFGKLDATEARVRHVAIFLKQKTDYVQEGTLEARRRWHNLKYYTWIEQQGKTVDELRAQAGQEWWQAERARIPAIVRQAREARGF
jgi:cysteine synthase